MNDAPLLTMRGIVKRFPGVLALGGVELEVRAGEVHCLLGQNGAGKSTLIKVLSASYQPDEGEILWEGEPVTLSTPQASMALGISTIYQELDLVPDLSVAENIFLGHELSTAGFSQRAETIRRTRPAGPAGPLRDPAHALRRPPLARRAADRQHGARALPRHPAAHPRRAVRGARPG
jgi:ABC-type sugar transport system ATPase subunit